MKKIATIVLVLCFIPWNNAQIPTWRSENNSPVPQKIKFFIESLLEEINKYFRKTTFTQPELEIIRTLQLSNDEILIIPTQRKLRIYLPASVKEITTYDNKLKISSALIAYKICPHLITFSDKIPIWVSAGFIHLSSQNIYSIPIKIPYYPFLNAISKYSQNPNYSEFLLNADVENAVYKQIIAEIGSVLLKHIQQKKSQQLLQDEITALLSSASDKKNNSQADKQNLLPSILPNENINNILSSVVINYFHPDSPTNTLAKIKNSLQEANIKIKEILENDTLTKNEKEQELSLIVRNTLTSLYSIQSSSPFQMRNQINQICLNLENACKKNSFSDITNLLILTPELEESTKECISIYSYLQKADKKYVSPAKRYSAVIEFINQNNHPDFLSNYTSK